MGYTFKPAEDVIQADPIPQEQPEEENACQASVFRNEELGQSMAIAQLKLALIMPAYQNLHDKKSNKAYFEDLAQHEIRMPDGSARRFKAKTFEKWLELYRKGGIETLMPKMRSDKGDTRAMDERAVRELLRVKEEHPKLNATQIHIYLARNGFIPAGVSVSTVQRFIKKKRAQRRGGPGTQGQEGF